MPSMSDQKYLGQQISHLLGETLSEVNLQSCLGSVQILEPSVAKQYLDDLLWFGAWLVINNQLTFGQLVAFNMLMGNVLSPFQRLSVLWNQLQEIIISAERINDVLEAEPEEDLQNNPRKSLHKLQGRIGDWVLGTGKEYPIANTQYPIPNTH